MRRWGCDLTGFKDQQELLDQALAFHRTGNLTEAESRYTKILQGDESHFLALYHLGIIRAQKNRYIEAIHLIGAALKVDASLAVAFMDYASVLAAVGRFDDALASIERALAIDPIAAGALNVRGNIFLSQNRFQEALASYDAALAIEPRNADAWNNRGFALRALNRLNEALESCGKAVAFEPQFIEAINNHGNVLSDLGRPEEALGSYNAALSMNPGYVDAWNNRGNSLLRLKRFDEALASFDRALAIQSNSVAALNGRGNALFHLQLLEESLRSYDGALTIQPGNVDALNNRGRTLRALGRYQASLSSYDAALALDSSNSLAYGGMAFAALNLCDWRRTREIVAQLESRVASGAAITPYTALGLSDDKALLLKCAENAIADIVPVRPQPPLAHVPQRKGKIRVGYISSDFRQHPMSHLIVGLIERHDRNQFEVVGISTGKDDGSDIRIRVTKAFDQFHDVQARNPRFVADFLAGLELDIIVDLNGHTQGHSLEALSHRPGAIQVTYLGFPGTSGSDFMDYIIADEVVAPFTDQSCYTEKIVHLPGCYFVNDPGSSAVTAFSLTRHEAGLPENAFVFCCFNNNWKITEPVFDIWMRLLKAVPGSVLWLLHDNAFAAENLRTTAAARGVDIRRIIFAARTGMDEHLARHGLADLFLDTLPYNAHTTAIDALWAGLPLITCRGHAFAGRVAASMLFALGAPELVADSLQGYESLALEIASDPSRSRAIRDKLAKLRLAAPLFDTDRFRQHLESAFTTMLDIQRSGKKPYGFGVKPDAGPQA